MAGTALSFLCRWLLLLLAAAAIASAVQEDYLQFLLQNLDDSAPAVRARRTLMHRSQRHDGHMPLRTIQNPSDLPMFRFG